MRQLPFLRISSRNPHQLQTDDGFPFLMIGDTAWELLHRLTLEEIEFYFQTRVAQGFNMIWLNLLPEFNGLTEPNRYGDLPFTDLATLNPSETYFAFVDRVVDLAAEINLYLGVLPAWGDKLTAPWGEGPRIFTLENLDVAEQYGGWLGNRYRSAENVLWVLGGDRPAKIFGHPGTFPMENALQAGLPPDIDWTPIWSSIAKGIRTSGASQLITFHPQGGPMSTSQFLHNMDWLDLNAMQSGHGGGHDIPAWNWISRDYQLAPVKPTFDSEPNYEDHPVNPWPTWDPADGFFDDFDIRKQIYRSILAGGCGVVYGHHCVWQFASERYEPILEVRFDWKSALTRPGAEGITHLKALITSLDFPSLIPDQSCLIGEQVAGGAHARAMRSDSEMIVYIPDGRTIELNLHWTVGKTVTVEEFDPISGATVQLEQITSAPPTWVVSTAYTTKDRCVVIRMHKDREGNKP